MGFRWVLRVRDGSPFDCACCGDKDMDARNCSNKAGLCPDATAVEKYTAQVMEELREKNARKVFSLGSIRLYECPVSYMSDDTRDLMRAVFLAQGSGRLLYGGGWGDQPEWFIEAYEIYMAEARLEHKDGSDG